MGQYVTDHYGSKYKTAQVYDLSKRIFNYMNKDLGAETLEWFRTYLGENSDFQHADLTTLPTLHNLHCYGKLICNSLAGSYPKPLLHALFCQGCRFLATRQN